MTGATRYVRPFGELGRDDIPSAGGKAANLGELARAGLPVPPGFVVTTERPIASSSTPMRLRDRIVALVPTPADADPAAYEAPPAAIHELFAAGSVPDELGHADRRGATPRWAPTRSPSARRRPPRISRTPASPASRTPTSTSAATDAVLDAVRRCWASLWTARAMAYRARQGIDPDDGEPGRGRPARWSTPSGRGDVHRQPDQRSARRRSVISAAWGLGEAVVSGPVNTDDLVLDRRRAACVTAPDRRQGGDDRATPSTAPRSGRCRPTRRRAAVLDDAAGGRSWPRSARGSRSTSARRRTSSGRAPTATFFIVQSRPITALPRPEARRRRPTGRCPTRPASTSGPASSSSCPTRSPRCSPT